MTNRLIRDIQRLSGEEGAYVTDVTISNYEARELLPMIEATDRAWWWREVTDAEEVIPKGCPMRREVGDTATEWIAEGYLKMGYLTSAHKTRFFKDSRWTPPRPVYKVGDVITEATEATKPADDVVWVDDEGISGQIGGRGRRVWLNGLNHSVEWEWLADFLPFTVIYVPKAGGDDD